MSALSFRSLDHAHGDGGFRPLLKSSFHRRLRDAGAQFEERDGWLLAVRVPREERLALRIRDVTHAFRIVEGHAETELADAVNALTPPTGHGRAFAAAYRNGGLTELAEGLIDTSAAFSVLEIDGPRATQLMRRLTELDLDDLPAVGSVAHVRTFVFRENDELYRLFIPQEYGHYLWEVVVDAAEPLHGGPAGVGA